MNKLDPIKSLRDAGGDSPAMLEQAQIAAAGYGRVATEPDPATGLPVKDATFNNGGGYSSLVSAGRGDTTDFPENVASVSGTRSSVDPEPIDFGHRLTPVPEDGFGAAASGVDAIVRGGR